MLAASGVGRIVERALIRAGIWRFVHRLPWGLIKWAVVGLLGFVVVGWCFHFFMWAFMGRRRGRSYRSSFARFGRG